MERALDMFCKYPMKILLEDFSAKVGREEVSKPIIAIESLHEISNDNGVRLVNFATSKNFTGKSTMLPVLTIDKIFCIHQILEKTMGVQ
jgi:hypothetical protein